MWSQEWLTWKCLEFINQEQVFAVGVRGHEIELLLELPVQRVALIHHADHKRLDVTSVSFWHGALQTDHISSIGLPVRDDDGHLPHTRPSHLEHLVGLLDGAARERTLAQVGHGAHRRLDLIPSGFLSEADHHHVDVAVKDHTHPRGVPRDRGPVDQGVYKFFDQVEVVGADAFRAVDHKNELQRGLTARHSTTLWSRARDKPGYRREGGKTIKMWVSDYLLQIDLTILMISSLCER